MRLVGGAPLPFDLHGRVRNLESGSNAPLNGGQHLVMCRAVFQDHMHAHRVDAGSQSPDVQVMNICDAGNITHTLTHSGEVTVRRRAFHVKLQKIGEFMGTNSLAAKENAVGTEGTNPLANSFTTQPASTAPPTATSPELTVEQLVQQSLSAVVTVQAGSSSGSGFFITESGIVVTNRHVVQGATQVGVTTSKGETFQSEALFVHPTKDLALIKLKAGTYPYMRLADPRFVNVGADVVAIGSPGLPGGSQILANTVTKGIVSAFRKSETYGLLIQTDMSINPTPGRSSAMSPLARVLGPA
jgi:Trypsin-like peptidase domain